jgi:DNA repair exonuclease SbcCD ATPase subunit
MLVETFIRIILMRDPPRVKNMVLRDAIGPLNKEARRVSASMTGGTIEVRYNTTRELASGLEKAQLNIEVDNKLGDKDLGGSSKGEAGLTNFIVAETLSEVGQVSRRVGYRWYDEIVPHQDPRVCHSIYSYMKEAADRLGIVIFLVDHNPVAANYADHVLIVEKAGSGNKSISTVRWR